MNKYILDANILFSGLLSKKEIYRKIFQENNFYLPDFALSEIAKYKKIILNKNKSAFKDLQEFVLFVFSKLIIVPDFYITDSSLQEAINLCKDIDEKDSVYIALNIEMNLPLVARDKELVTGLTQKKYVNIILFDEFIRGQYNF